MTNIKKGGSGSNANKGGVSVFTIQGPTANATSKSINNTQSSVSASTANLAGGGSVVDVLDTNAESKIAATSFAFGGPGDINNNGALLTTLFDSNAGEITNKGEKQYKLHRNNFCAFSLPGIADLSKTEIDSISERPPCSVVVTVTPERASWKCICKNMILNDSVQYPYFGSFPGCAFVFPTKAVVKLDIGDDKSQFEEVDAAITEFDYLTVQQCVILRSIFC